MADKSLLEASSEITFEDLTNILGGPNSQNIYFFLAMPNNNYKIKAIDLINGLKPIEPEVIEPQEPPTDENTEEGEDDGEEGITEPKSEPEE